MAEYDNIQLYSNYQSHNTTNDSNNSTLKCLKSRVAWNNKRRKANHCDENMTTIKCQRPNNNCRSSPAATRLINLPLQSDVDRSRTSLIASRYDNNSNKSVITKSSRRYCIDDTDNNEESRRDNAVHRHLPIRKYFSCYNKSNTFTLALLLVIGLLFKINLSCGFILDGTQNSYAQFRKWYTGLNGSLELEFKTEQPNGLVLYTDDGGTYDFFELKLVEGALRLRYNLGGGAQIITVGRDLHDGHWHKVQVSAIRRINNHKSLSMFNQSLPSSTAAIVLKLIQAVMNFFFSLCPVRGRSTTAELEGVLLQFIVLQSTRVFLLVCAARKKSQPTKRKLLRLLLGGFFSGVSLKKVSHVSAL
jgi:Laminin G domain